MKICSYCVSMTVPVHCGKHFCYIIVVVAPLRSHCPLVRYCTDESEQLNISGVEIKHGGDSQVLQHAGRSQTKEAVRVCFIWRGSSFNTFICLGFLKYFDNKVKFPPQGDKKRR